MLRSDSCQVRPKLSVCCKDNIPKDLIERLFFCKQVDVLRVVASHSTFTPTNITASFYICQLPLESVVQLDTLKAFGFPGKERRSHLKGIVLLRSAVDRTNNLCVTPEGFLHLVLDKESYEQFGLVGKKLKGKFEYFHIQIDLHRIATGKQSTLRSRLEWCLKKLANPVELVVSCTIPLEQVPLQGLQSYRKLSIDPSNEMLEEKPVPLIENWIIHWSSSDRKGETVEEDIHSDIEFFVQWIGAVVTHCPALMDIQSELLCEYVCPHLEEMYPKDCFRNDCFWTTETIQHQQWQGFIGNHVTKTIAESIQKEVQEENVVKWAMLVFHSLEDAPILYKNSKIRAPAPAVEHSLGLVLIILPGGTRCFVIQPNTKAASLCG